MNLADKISNELTEIRNHPNFKAGDNITVYYKIKKEIKNVSSSSKVMFYKLKVKKQLKLSLSEKFPIMLV